VNSVNTKSSVQIPSVVLFKVLLTLIFILTFIFSYVMSQFYVEGDQIHYIRAYAAMDGLGFLEALNVYPTIIHTAELGHFLVIWVFSSIGIEKNMVMAAANALLAMLFAKFLRQKGGGLWMVAWITFSAYYLHTMFFTLERTKFAFIFMLLYLLSQKRWWLLFAVFTHSMMLIPMGLNLAGQKLFGQSHNLQAKPLSRHLLKLLQLLAGLAFLLLLFDSLGLHIYSKFSAYFYENLGNENFEGWPLIVLCLLTLLTTQNKRITLLFYFSLLLLAMLIGSSRVNMLGYFVYLYFSNFQHQSFRLSVFMIGLYLIYKTWVYLSNIYYFGG
jgi:hypothetical protein